MYCNSNNYVLTTIATISFILLFSTVTNPLYGYDLDDVKSSIAYEEAINEFDLPANAKNFSMELDNGLIANYYLAPNQTYVFDGVSGAISEQDDSDNDGDGKKKIKYYVDVTVTTTYSYPQSQDKPQDPRNDPKYDSIDWQDDRGEEYNLSQEEMDEILEEQEQEEQNNDSDNDGSNDETSDSTDGQDDSGGDDSGGDDSGGDDSGGDDSGGDDS